MNNKGVFIPESILKLNLSLTDKVVASQILYLDNGTGCVAKVSTIAGMIYTPERSVRNSIKNLVDAGVITEANEYNTVVRKVNFTDNGDVAIIAENRQKLPKISKICREDKEQKTAKIAEKSAKIAEPTAKIADPLYIKNTLKKFKEIIYSGDYDFLATDVKDLLVDFVQLRFKDKKHPFTDRALKMAINQLTKLSTDSETQKLIIEQTIINGWKAFYPLKNNQKPNNSNVDVLDKLEKEFEDESDLAFLFPNLLGGATGE